MKIALLAGGLGSRLSEKTDLLPKPMIEIGGRPILWHIMKHYAHFGFRDFLIALGYKGDVIKDYFLNYNKNHDDVVVNLKSSQAAPEGSTDGWTVDLLETGANTQTGGRLRRMMEHVGNEPLMLTYGDGVSDVNVVELFNFHKAHGKAATVTAAHPPARFGEVRFSGDRIESFSEKPQSGVGWINAGFFVLEPRVLNYLGDDATVFERTPLERLAQDGELMGFKHERFWQCMDTLRDVRVLEKMCSDGTAPWKLWKD